MTIDRITDDDILLFFEFGCVWWCAWAEIHRESQKHVMTFASLNSNCSFLSAKTDEKLVRLFRLFSAESAIDSELLITKNYTSLWSFHGSFLYKSKVESKSPLEMSSTCNCFHINRLIQCHQAEAVQNRKKRNGKVIKTHLCPCIFPFSIRGKKFNP